MTRRRPLRAAGIAAWVFERSGSGGYGVADSAGQAKQVWPREVVSIPYVVNPKGERSETEGSGREGKRPTPIPTRMRDPIGRGVRKTQRRRSPPSKASRNSLPASAGGGCGHPTMPVGRGQGRWSMGRAQALCRSPRAPQAPSRMGCRWPGGERLGVAFPGKTTTFELSVRAEGNTEGTHEGSAR